MASTYFQITAQNVEKKINPSDRELLFSIGSGANDQMTETDVDTIIAEKEAKAVSYLPEKYRRHLLNIEGEVVCKFATDAQTSLQLGLYPVVADSVRLYPDFSRAWPDRTPDDEIDRDSYAVTLATGAIVLDDGLTRSTKVVAEYAHTGGANFAALRDAVIALVAVEIARRYNFFSQPDRSIAYDQWEVGAIAYLKDIAAGRAGIPAIDRLELYSETKTASLGDLGLDGGIGW